LARLTTALEHGELTVPVRVRADASDRQFIRTTLHRATTAFLGAATGLMAVLLLNATGGPDIRSAVSLFHLPGYNLLLVSIVLVLRALTWAPATRRTETDRPRPPGPTLRRPVPQLTTAMQHDDGHGSIAEPPSTDEVDRRIHQVRVDL
jgi:hypothetical protein